MSAPQSNGHLPSGFQTRNRRKGSDPLLSTARGKLQTRRSKLNDQINRELRMRNGAENLFRATANKRLKELVAVELSFFNSNIQLLKEELSDLNSDVIVYQHENGTCTVPMIPLGLKETTECDFSVSIKDFILEHYSEEGDNYSNEIQEFSDLRQSIRTPQRTEAGVELLVEYFNQLHFLEKRFFPPDRPLGVHFHWYDSLTGVPNTQRTMGFEKGSVLFNIGALYTQIGCKQDRATHAGLQDAIMYFQLAAGTFRYLHNHFTKAPSMDMQPNTLTMLIQLMMSQAQECVYELKVFGGIKVGMVNHVKIAQEAAYVSQMYEDTQMLMSSDPVKDYIPYSWVSMALVKSQYYMAIAHDVMATAMIDPDVGSVDEGSIQFFMEALQNTNEVDNENNQLKVPRSKEERIQLGKAHLKEALICHEEALRLHDLCKQLRKIDTFLEILKKAHDRSLEKFASLEEEDDFSEVVISPMIISKSEQSVSPTAPEFKRMKVSDTFSKLGPITIFNAKNSWSAPRLVILDRGPEQGYGFSVRGDAPVRVAEMEAGSVAETSKLKVGDFVVAVGDKDTKWAKHEEVVSLVRQCGNHLELKLVTPDTPLGSETPRSASGRSTPATPRRMQSPRESISTQSNKSNRSRLSAPWIFMRKGSKEKQDKPEKSKEFEDHDVLFQ